MHIKKYSFFLVSFFIGITSLHAQKEQAEICIDFRINSANIDPTYMDNEARLTEILNYIDRLHRDTLLKVTRLVFSGVASPEGSVQVNKMLANKRLSALENYICSRITLPDSLVIARNDTYIPWNYLIAQVETSDLDYKDEVLSILKGKSQMVPYLNGSTIDSRIPALKKLDNGKVWLTLNQRYFARMRNACAVFLAEKSELMPEPTPEPAPAPVPAPVPPIKPDKIVADTVIVPIIETVRDTVVTPPLPETKEWVRHLYLKTNTIGWGMLISNLAVEIDLAKHWSFTLPVYYSALNYFTSKVKFRTMCLQPEVRYWLNEDNKGWFAGAHLGVAWFNYAKGGDWRYQDHNRRTPLLGGGISGGYRMPISSNRRWWMEFSLGGGAYRLYYDIFHNERNGKLVYTRKGTFYGIDNVAVSFAYRFDFKKKGGNR